MDDREFDVLKLKASLCPHRDKWPDKYLHWQQLGRCVDEARERVAKAWAAMDEISADRDLSSQGRDRKKKKVADETIADLQKSKTLSSAKAAVERQLANWKEKTGMTIKPPANIAEAVVQSEIRAHLTAMSDSKLGFIDQHLTDPRVASAVLGAPSFLSGMTDAEITMVQKRIEHHVAPEIAEARESTLKALEQAEQSWHRAQQKIADRAGLSRSSDNRWGNQSGSRAA